LFDITYAVVNLNTTSQHRALTRAAVQNANRCKDGKLSALIFENNRN
jgi:hypothetical protein